MSKKIVFVTGTRADFGKLEPLAKCCVDLGFDVLFFVTGMHMLKKYGLTKIEVHEFVGAEVFEFINQRSVDDQDIIMSKTIVGFSDFIKETKPDLVIVHGDRIEALSCSLVCATNYIRCAHVEGGELSGTIDEVLRHSITKLSNIHLVSSEEAKDRVLMLGEGENSVYVIGSPELDVHRNPSIVSIEEVKSYYDISFDDYGILIFHPVTSEKDDMAFQAKHFLSTLKESSKNFVVILPNNDPGSEHIIHEINKLPATRFRIIPSIRFHYFSELLKSSKAVVGNSSIGVREAPFIGVPSLNVGSRQTNRSNATSIKFCNANSSEKIHAFLQYEWGRKYPSFEGFGDGNAVELFKDLLLDKSFWNLPLQKQFNKN